MDSCGEKGHEGCALDYEECACFIIHYRSVSSRWLPQSHLYIPYVKKSAQENVFPIIHSPTPPKIWTIPPKKINTGLHVFYKLLVSFLPFMMNEEKRKDNSYTMAAPWPPAPLQPIMIQAFEVEAIKKPSKEMGVGLPSFLLRFPETRGFLGLR